MMADYATGTRVSATNPQSGEEGWQWVIVDGTRRPIADTTYNTLYVDKNSFQLDNLYDIPEGSEISSAYLANDDDGTTYLVTEGTKYKITSQAAVDKLGFDKSNARTGEDLNSMGAGADIS